MKDGKWKGIKVRNRATVRSRLENTGELGVDTGCGGAGGAAGRRGAEGGARRLGVERATGIRIRTVGAGSGRRFGKMTERRKGGAGVRVLERVRD